MRDRIIDLGLVYEVKIKLAELSIGKA